MHHHPSPSVTISTFTLASPAHGDRWDWLHHPSPFFPTLKDTSPSFIYYQYSQTISTIAIGVVHDLAVVTLHLVQPNSTVWQARPQIAHSQQVLLHYAAYGRLVIFTLPA